MLVSYHPTAKTPRDAVYGFLETSAAERAMASCIWGGCCWSGGRRREANFAFSDWMVLDFDDGQMLLDEAIKTWCDCVHIIGTTRSHRIDKGGTKCDRFRVAVPWSRRITDRLEFRFNMSKMTEKYPCDPQCKDAARLYFPCRELVSISFDGYKQDVLIPPAGYGQVAPVAPTAVGTGIVPSHVRTWLRFPARPGQLRATWFKIGAELARYGFPLPDAIAIAARSNTGKNATAENPLREMEECVRGGWYKERSKGGN